jgi:hypothetical protein
MSLLPLTLDEADTVLATPDQVSCDIGNQMAILNMKNGVYYGLDSVGSRIWELLQQPRRVSEVESALLAEYDVEPGRLRPDLEQVCGAMAEAGLIEIHHAARG